MSISLLSLFYDCLFHYWLGLSMLAIYCMNKLYEMNKSHIHLYYFLSIYVLISLLNIGLNYYFLNMSLTNFWLIVVNLSIVLCGWYIVKHLSYSSL